MQKIWLIDWLIDWFERHVNLSRVILCQEVMELH